MASSTKYGCKIGALRSRVYRESKDGFWRFVEAFWDQVPGAGMLKSNWHMRVIANELQSVAMRLVMNEPKEYDCIFNVPPGTSKSTICSILFPAWLWTIMPHARIMTASHTDSLVLDLAAKSRAVIKSDLYRSSFPDIQLREDQDTKGYFANTLGGDRYTCTVAGKSPMGFHAHVIIVDDPLDPKKILSEAEIGIARNFMDNVIPTRKVDKAATVTILVMQRLGKRDPTDVMLEGARREGAAKIRHYCLPSNLVKGADGKWIESDVLPMELARCYVDGLLDPVRLPEVVLLEYKARGNHFFETQFRQKPFSQQGGLFKDHYFNQRIRAAPYKARRIRYWDRASTEDGGCFTAGVLLAKDDDGYYVEHVVLGQWEPTERNARMRATALRDRAKYGPNYEPIIYVESEGGSAGRDAWKGVMRALDGFHVCEDRPSGSKDVRAEPWSSQLAAKNVYIVDDGSWDVFAYVQEHLAFKPDMASKRLGKYKDQVDASSAAYSILSGARQLQPLRTHTIGRSQIRNCSFIVTTEEELQTLVIDDRRCFLIVIRDPLKQPVQEELPLHGLSKLISWCVLHFAAIDPKDHQSKWDAPVEGYDAPPERLIMSRDHGKRLWTSILRHKEQYPEIYVIADDTDGSRAMSVALAMCDQIRLPRGSSIQSSHPGDYEGMEAPIRFVYDMTKMCRSLVLG